MTTETFEFRFDPGVLMDEAADTLQLARLAAEALHGPERVALGATTAVDAPGRTVTVAATSAAGTDLALVFLGYCRREFGGAAVRVSAGAGPGG